MLTKPPNTPTPTPSPQTRSYAPDEYNIMELDATVVLWKKHVAVTSKCVCCCQFYLFVCLFIIIMCATVNLECLKVKSYHFFVVSDIAPRIPLAFKLMEVGDS